MVHKNLYKSEKNKVISGICGGLGEYFDVDPTIIRLGWILVSILTGIIGGLIIYVIATFIIPVKPKAMKTKVVRKKKKK